MWGGGRWEGLQGRSGRELTNVWCLVFGKHRGGLVSALQTTVVFLAGVHAACDSCGAVLVLCTLLHLTVSVLCCFAGCVT
jgi:hypothetical protein